MGVILGVMAWSLIILLTLNDMVEHTVFNYYSWFAAVLGIIVGVVAIVVSIFVQDKLVLKEASSKFTYETAAIFVAQFPITMYLMWLFNMEIQIGLYILSVIVSWTAALICKTKSQ